MQLLKRRKEFNKAFKEGVRLKCRYVTISLLNRSAPPSRFAFVAAKRLGNAVYRNRCKRVLREAVRHISFSGQPFDAIFFATSKTIEAHPHEIREEIIQALHDEKHSV